ncbi:hypothetical protein CEXT_793051 [Caerostris extrusa]|uniref:Uncharacterized protein n=1 Tax=Caerostris extrusa TaxID=172846 RepID=A0AAV4VEV7_CAEEX|nr:hypothetical protein CEXT_793051 [Caerostris extrusa]
MVNSVILYSSSVHASASKDEARKKELLCPLEELAGGERFSYLLINDFCAASDSSLSFAGCRLAMIVSSNPLLDAVGGLNPFSFACLGLISVSERD